MRYEIANKISANSEATMNYRKLMESSIDDSVFKYTTRVGIVEPITVSDYEV